MLMQRPIANLRSGPGAAEIWMAVPQIQAQPGTVVVDGGFGGTGPTGNATTPSGQSGTGAYAITGGQGRVTNGAATQSYIWIDIPVIAGRAYDLSLDLVAGTSGSSCRVQLRQSNDSIILDSAGAGYKSSSNVVATGSVIRFAVTPGTATSGHTAFFDNIDVRLNRTSQAAEIFKMARSLGVRGVRLELEGEWSFFGNSAGRYLDVQDEWAALCYQYGMKMCLVETSTAAWATPGNSANFPTTQLSAWAGIFTEVAARYAGICDYWQLRNELNQPKGDVAAGDTATQAATKYIDYCKAMVPAIKTGNPRAKIISQGLSPVPAGGTVSGQYVAAGEYLAAMYANGGKGLFDLIGFHPYSCPEQPDSGNSWNGWTIMEREIRAIMAANGEGARPICISEFGFPTAGSGGSQTSEADAGRGTQKALWMAKKLGNVPIFTYYTAMDIRGSEASSTDTEDYFGYQRQTLAEKTPVTEAIRYATRRIV